MRYCRRMIFCSSTRQPSLPSRPVRILRLFTLLLWAFALAFLSLVPEVEAPAGLQLWDKFNHFAAYAVLTLLLIRTLSAWRSHSDRLLTVAWLACAAYGMLIEGLQWAMGVGRQWEFGDLLANALGALAACVVFRLISVRSSVVNDQ